MLTAEMTPIDAALIVRDPAEQLARLRAEWGGRTDLWVFGYASLIWRPEFDAAEHRPALVRGWHRALRMRSRVNRGTPQQPGLVFALMPGGACRGMVYRMQREKANEELERLWAREMPTGVYDARFLPCRTAHGVVPALAFTLSRRSESYMGRIADEQLVHILRHASGRFGTTLDYVARTAGALREHGMCDRELERLMRLAAHHGLVHERPLTALPPRPEGVEPPGEAGPAQDPAARTASRSATVSTSTSAPGSSTSQAQAG